MATATAYNRAIITGRSSLDRRRLGRRFSLPLWVRRRRDWLSRGRVAVWLRRMYARRPFLTSALALSFGMVALMTLFARDAGLSLRHYAAIALVTIALAWLCTWIVFLEDAEPAPDDGEGPRS